MSSARVDIISIGALSRNRLWNEQQAIRTPHSTTSLIRTGDRLILVDPGLPAMALGARLNERTGVRPTDIDTVFLTNSRAAHRGGLSLFAGATVLIHEFERDYAVGTLESLLREAPPADKDRAALEAELKLIRSFRAADEKLAAGVDLFPLFGYTPGTCGLLVSSPTITLMIAGDAVPTQDHFLAGQVLPDTANISAAHDSMREVYEIADLIVPGHDNIFLNPRTQGM